MIIVLTSLVAIVAIAFVLLVRPKDLPAVEPPSPFRHLDERKASIYENLRDLQFEYRVGKLSDADYQHTKQDLQKELAGVMAAVDMLKAEIKAELNGHAVPPPATPKPQAAETDGRTCPTCGATFEKKLKFCGECGKPMKVAAL